MRPGDIRLPGAVDLSALRRPPAPPTAGSTGADQPSAAGSLIVAVTEASFETEVVARSRQVPVVIDFWADWCGPCKQLSPILERLVAADAGKWVLATIDVDAEQRIAQAFQIQSIPSVLAVIAGQPVPLFQGALPEAQVRQVLDEVLRVAAANGVTGTVTPVDADTSSQDDGAAAAPPPDPEYAAAQAALDRGDIDAALAAYRSLLERRPGDPALKAAVARCELLLRTKGADEAAVRARAAADPSDVSAALAVADLDMLLDQVDAAVTRLVEVVRRSDGEQRDAARARLLSLFDVLDPEDPRLAAGRRALANALF